jgi:hypothetical protein
MIVQHHEQYVNDSLHLANRKQRQYDYSLGEQVLKKVHDPTKLGVRATGPYTIEQAHVNDMLTIELHPGPGLTECIIFCNVILYQ